MEDNVKNMLDNATNLNRLEGKTSNMKDAANTFNKQSHDLERLMYWRNMKLKIIIALVIIAVLAYILIPIIAANVASGSSDNEETDTADNSAETKEEDTSQ